MAAVLPFLLFLLSVSPSVSTPIFLSCGSSSSHSIPSDNPPRNFTPDSPYLLSPDSTRTSSSPSSNPLYSSARLFLTPSSYSFPLTSNSSYYFLRLHFFPSSSSSASSFNVSALDRYLLLSFYSPPNSTFTVLEFLLLLPSSTLILTFSPNSPSPAFLNALELLPSDTLSHSHPLYLSPSHTSPLTSFSPPASQTLFRLNVGGSQIMPSNDTLWRHWDPDASFLLNPSFSFQNSTNAHIHYPTEEGLTPSIAPEMLYRSARTMNTSPDITIPDYNFNLTWTFIVPRDFKYLIRLHFCNNWFPQSTFFFNVYVGGLTAASDMKPLLETDQITMSPFFRDFVVDATEDNGKLNVSIGSSIQSNPRNAFLNGLEVMKLSNSYLSLAGPFGLNPPDHGGGSTHLLPILLPSLLGGFLVVLLIVVLLFRRRRPPHPEKEQKQETPASWVGAGVSPETNSVFSASSKSTAGLNLGLHISLEHIQWATDNFNEKLVIGAGGFGKVYKGVLRDGTIVAVKRAMPGHRQGFPEFQTEIVVLSRIRHRHLVSLVAFCEEQSEMILVYEYMEKGPLRNYLYGSSENLPCLSWKQRLEICIGAARGLHYLHTGYSQSIIHRDVKSTNILLGEDFTAKVSDFGLSRLGPSMGETHVSTGVKGTFGYLDPEYFKIQKLTAKSDIYSLGVVLFEVLCARPAINGHVNLAELAVHWQRKGKLEEIVDRRLAGSINENSLRKFGETAAKCLADYGDDRPSIGDVLWNLEYALQLQQTQLRWEPLEDSGEVEGMVAVPEPVRQLPPLSPKFRIAEVRLVADEESESASSLVFSQLVAGEGR